MLCFKERSQQKKKYSNSKVREENIVVVYYSLRAMIIATRKVYFITFFSLPLGGDGGCRWELAIDTCLTDGVVADWVGWVGASEPLTHLFWKLPSTLRKSCDLFSNIEILGNKSKILKCSMSPVKLSWNTW